MMDLSYLSTTDFARLSDEELERLLTARGELQQALFHVARDVRREAGLDDVLLRGVIEISNLCQKKCNYCAMRCHNSTIDRYRLDAETILTIAREIHAIGITTLFLQAGQDPGCDPILEQVIPEVKRELGAEVLLCVGERPKHVYQRFADLGATSYILKFETSSAALYEQTCHVSPDYRNQCIQWIQEAGMKIGTGNIVGLPGQEMKTLIEDLRMGVRLRPDFISCAPFIANQDTPFEDAPPGDVDVALNTMALWRIALKNALVPSVSALEKLRHDGQLHGLMAGANVITINFTPRNVRNKYKIYAEDRFVVSLQHAMETIRRAGLQPRNPITPTVTMHRVTTRAHAGDAVAKRA